MGGGASTAAESSVSPNLTINGSSSPDSCDCGICSQPLTANDPDPSCTSSSSCNDAYHLPSIFERVGTNRHRCLRHLSLEEPASGGGGANVGGKRVFEVRIGMEGEDVVIVKRGKGEDADDIVKIPSSGSISLPLFGGHSVRLERRPHTLTIPTTASSTTPHPYRYKILHPHTH